MDKETELDAITMYDAIIYQYALVEERLDDLKRVQGHNPEAQGLASQALQDQASKVTTMVEGYRTRNPDAAKLVENPLGILEQRCLDLCTPEIFKITSDALNTKADYLRKLGINLK